VRPGIIISLLACAAGCAADEPTPEGPSDAIRGAERFIQGWLEAHDRLDVDLGMLVVRFEADDAEAPDRLGGCKGTDKTAAEALLTSQVSSGPSHSMFAGFTCIAAGASLENALLQGTIFSIPLRAIDDPGAASYELVFDQPLLDATLVDTSPLVTGTLAVDTATVRAHFLNESMDVPYRKPTAIRFTIPRTDLVRYLTR
jgi:hypothetical protein